MIKLLLLLTLPLLLHARKGEEKPPVEAEAGPWLTGPLLTPSGHVIPLGHQNYEPYFYWTKFSSSYDKHWHSFRVPPTLKILLSQTSLQFGIFPKVELNLLPQFQYNNRGGKHAWHVTDQPITVGIQLLMDRQDRWYPAIKLRLGFLIPIGKYDRLDPLKLLTDFSGTGNWGPNIGLTTSRQYHFSGAHYLSWRMNWTYIISTPVPVHGLSIYGGVPSIDGIKGTRGTVYPANIFTIQQGFEYTLTRNWALALDLMYLHTEKTRFSGHTLPGTEPIAPSSEQFSIAPAIEYNFNANIGIIAGPWFSVGGRNDNLSGPFSAWIFAINIYN